MRKWLYIAVAAAVYVACGFWLGTDTGVEIWIYRVGLTAATFAPLVFVGLYTILGLRGKAKWWRNRIGTALVEAALTVIPIVAPFAWAIWFDDGKVAPAWLVWFELSGPVVCALAWLQLCAIWLIERRANKEG